MASNLKHSMRVSGACCIHGDGCDKAHCVVVVPGDGGFAVCRGQTGASDTDVVLSVTSRIERFCKVPRVTKRREKEMGDLKDKVKEQIDDAAEATKKVLDKAVDKTKDVAHEIGKRVEQGGKRLKDA